MKQLLGLLLLSAMALLTFRQSLVWQSEESLWKNAVEVSPLKPRPHNNLGLEYQKQNRLDEAMGQYQSAIRLSQDPRRLRKDEKLITTIAQSNISLIYLVRGNYAETERLASEALLKWPGMQPALVNRGIAEIALGNCEAARIDLHAAGVQELPSCRKD